MKNLLFSALVFSLAFISCKKDDDGDDGNGGCQTCEQTISGVAISTEYCDNGDGTFTTTIQGGQSTTQSLGGAPFSAIITTAENGGATCN